MSTHLSPLSPQISPRALAIFPFMTLPFVSQFAVAPVLASDVDTTVIDQQSAHLALRVNFVPALASISKTKNRPLTDYQWVSVEALQVQWLIGWFKRWFCHRDTILVKGEHEPEYFAATDTEPAKIVFAHGFFASALHEISHWCMAGQKRRLLNDFGYWYAPDGRNEEQQQQFEQVEILPQAIECLLTLACNKPFSVSKDNLFADFDTSQSTFEADVQAQSVKFWQTGQKLSTDAKVLLSQLTKLRPLPLTSFDIYHNFIKVNFYQS